MQRTGGRVAHVRTIGQHVRTKSADRAITGHTRPVPSSSSLELSPPLGLAVARYETSPGIIELAEAPVHRIRVHAGAPVRGTCGAQPFRYTRGDIDVLPSGASDRWHERDPSSALMLELSPRLVRRAAEDVGRDPDRTALAPQHQIRDPQIEHIVYALEAHHRAGRPNGTLYEDSLGVALALHLLGQFAISVRSPRGLSRPQLRRVTEFIEAHLGDDLSLERLSVVAGVSASHLKTLFKRSTGSPVHAFVMQRRVERARTLLQRGEMPASQIALAAGFAHQSHMARCVRRILGVNPAVIARMRDR